MNDSAMKKAYLALQQHIRHSMAASPLADKMPLVIGASKTQPEPVLEAAIAAGLRDFGENRMQEAQAKWPALKHAHPEVRLHYIGKLQSNKVQEAVALFDVIHTLDRAKLADALKREMDVQNRQPMVLIQVNTGEEPQKSGVRPAELEALLAHCKAIDLPITGLMCVPPAEQAPAPHFALLYKLAQQYGLKELSMGMSGDYIHATQMGATMLRIGTALFGARQ